MINKGKILKLSIKHFFHVITCSRCFILMLTWDLGVFGNKNELVQSFISNKSLNGKEC